MALIKCKECGREISDKATACIHCGCPVEVNNQEKGANSRNGRPNRKTRIIAGVFLLFVICSGVAWYICKSNPLKSATAEVELKTNIDTISYAIGMYGTLGFKEYVNKEFGLDTVAFVEKFSEGFKEGIYKESVSISDEELKGEDKDEVARLLGIKIGCQLNNETLKMANRELFANDSVRTLSLPIFTMGFLNGVANQFNIMTFQEATQRVNEFVQKVTEEKRLKEEQEKETKRREEERQKAQAMSRFVGTYWLDCGLKTERFYNNPIVILGDGRCLLVQETLGGSKDVELLGDVVVLSSSTFSIKGKTVNFGPSLYFDYIDTEGKEHKYSMGVRGAAWNNYDPPIFDLDLMRVYKHQSEYQNRDVSTAYYTVIKSKTSSTSLTQ